MSNKKTPEKPDREKQLRDMAAELGKLHIEMLKAQKRYATAHNDKLCAVRTPTAADRRDVAALKRRHFVLSRKWITQELAMREFMGIPELLEDPRKSLG